MPDYTLRATSDTTFLKVRKNTYLVAVKATRLETSTSCPAWREEELEEVLVNITQNDADFCLRKQSEGSERRERRDERRDSVWSTISIIKSRLGGRSNNSFNNIREEREERPWEVVGDNNNLNEQDKAETEVRPDLRRVMTLPASQPEPSQRL